MQGTRVVFQAGGGGRDARIHEPAIETRGRRQKQRERPRGELRPSRRCFGGQGAEPRHIASHGEIEAITDERRAREALRRHGPQRLSRALAIGRVRLQAGEPTGDRRHQGGRRKLGEKASQDGDGGHPFGAGRITKRGHRVDAVGGAAASETPTKLAGDTRAPGHLVKARTEKVECHTQARRRGVRRRRQVVGGALRPSVEAGRFDPPQQTGPSLRETLGRLGERIGFRGHAFRRQREGPLRGQHTVVEAIFAGRGAETLEPGEAKFRRRVLALGGQLRTEQTCPQGGRGIGRHVQDLVEETTHGLAIPALRGETARREAESDVARSRRHRIFADVGRDKPFLRHQLGQGGIRGDEGRQRRGRRRRRRLTPTEPRERIAPNVRTRVGKLTQRQRRGPLFLRVSEEGSTREGGQDIGVRRVGSHRRQGNRSGRPRQRSPQRRSPGIDGRAPLVIAPASQGLGGPCLRE